MHTRVFQKKHFFGKIKSTAHHALACGLVWKDPKWFLISRDFQGAKSHSSVRESKQKFTTPLSPSNTFWQQLQLWQFWMARWYLWPFLFCQFRWRWWQHSWWFVVREGKWIVVISSDSTWCPLAGHTLAQYQVVATDSIIQECECPWIRGQRMTIIEREGTVGRYVRGRQKWYLRKQSSQARETGSSHEDRALPKIWDRQYTENSSWIFISNETISYFTFAFKGYTWVYAVEKKLKTVLICRSVIVIVIVKEPRPILPHPSHPLNLAFASRLPSFWSHRSESICAGACAEIRNKK